LWVETGSYGGAPFAVTLAPGGELVLGSTDAATVRIDDVTVSARHCRVTHAGASIEVADLGARNGVRVGGVRVPRATLSLGGTFEIGRPRVRVQPSGATMPRSGPPLKGLVGGSVAMRVLAGMARRVAPLRLPVLLRGESGTGKDLVARALHEEGPRA